MAIKLFEIYQIDEFIIIMDNKLHEAKAKSEENQKAKSEEKPTTETNNKNQQQKPTTRSRLVAI